MEIAQSGLQRRRALEALRRPLAWAGALLLLALAAHAPALGAAFIIDDSAYVTGDRRMDSLGGLARIWTEVGALQYQHQYYPLTSTTFWLQHALWGDRPLGYHLVNILLHGANAILLWRLLAGLRAPGAWLAAAIFAVHPVHVQSVAWVAELKNVLSAFFLLASMLVLVRWHGLDGEQPAPPAPPRDLGSPGVYALGTGLYLCALLSKTAACLLPAALLLVAWWKRGRLSRRDLLAAAPLAALGIAFVLLTAHLETGAGGANGAEFARSPVERTLIAGRALWFYLSTLAWPAGLSFVYPRWQIDAGAWWQWLYPAAAVAAAGGLWWQRRRLGRAPAAALALFAVATVPLAFVDVAFTRHSFVSDHWQYLASVGPIALGAGAAASLRVRRAWSPAPARAAAAVLIAGLAALCFNRATVYRTPDSLWRDTIARNPGSWMAHNNLGVALMTRGRWTEADGHLREAIRLAPGSARAHFNLGNTLQALGRIAEAVEHFQASVVRDPQAAEAHYNLGNALAQADRVDDAIESYRRAVQQDPLAARAWSNLGAALLVRGRSDDAESALQEALRLEPAASGASFNLGLVLAGAGRHQDAIERFQAVLRAQPDNAGALARIEASRQALAAAGPEP